MSEVTRILSAIEQSGRHAAGQLVPIVYKEHRQLAAHKLSKQSLRQMPQAVALE